MSYTKTTWVDNQPPYINAENLNKIENQLETNTNDIATNASAIETNSNNITINTNAIAKLQGEILWTNANPTSDFGTQTITLNKSLDSYNCYEILFRQSKTASRIMTSGKVPVGYGTILVEHANIYRPTGTTVSGNTIYFEDAKNNGSTTVVEVVPVYVIGYETGIF